MANSYRFDNPPFREQPRHLLDVLKTLAEANRDKVFVEFWKEKGPVEKMTFGELRERAEIYGGFLRKCGIHPADRVMIILPTSKEFPAAFFGILIAGGIPVPIYPPFGLRGIEEYIQRNLKIIQNCAGVALITISRIKRIAYLLKGKTTSIKRVITVEEIERKARVRPVPYPQIHEDDTAFLQYTSGSTGDPKGVEISHLNVLSNCYAIGELLKFTPRDYALNWLPLYHDMGLIGMIIVPLCYGVTVLMMSPVDFLVDPGRWLINISKKRATITSTPNFAFSYCLKKVKEEKIRNIDLSSWRVAFNGAEPINYQTMRSFYERFKEYGFRMETFLPVYGLAENTLIVTSSRLDEEPVVDRIDRKSLERQGKAVKAQGNDQDVLFRVSVGRPVVGTEIRVVDEEGKDMGERRESEIVVRGNSVMKGYFVNTLETDKILKSGWLYTGDLGYTAEGNLYITGRKKDLIIKHGMNYYPQDIEAAAEVVLGVRTGCVAAFGIYREDGDTEDMVVIAETRIKDPSKRSQIKDGLKREVNKLIGCNPDDIVLVPPRTIPKTSSGKIRRLYLREMYLSGDLHKAPLSPTLAFLKIYLVKIRDFFVRAFSLKP